MAKKKLTGRSARYRGKLNDRPIVVSLTPEGHAALADGVSRTGLSRSDYIETLLRRARRRSRVAVWAREKKPAARQISA